MLVLSPLYVSFISSIMVSGSPIGYPTIQLQQRDLNPRCRNFFERIEIRNNANVTGFKARCSINMRLPNCQQRLFAKRLPTCSKSLKLTCQTTTSEESTALLRTLALQLKSISISYPALSNKISSSRRQQEQVL